MFWVAVTVNVNADEAKGTVSTLGDSRNKPLVGSTEDSPETIPVWGFLLRSWYGYFLTVKSTIIVATTTHKYSYIG